MLPPEPVGKAPTSMSEKLRPRPTLSSSSLLEAPSDIIPFPGVVEDSLAPRGANFDCMLRPVDEVTKKVIYQKKMDEQSLQIKITNRDDEKVWDFMRREPDLSKAIQSLVFLRVFFMKQDGSFSHSHGTGVLMSPKIIFTTAHTLEPPENQTIYEINAYENEKDLLEERNCLFARRQEIPHEAASLLEPYHCCTTYQLAHGGEQLDFSVLELETRLERPIDSFLKMPSTIRTSDEEFQSGTVVCGLGLPVRPSENIPLESFFPVSVSLKIRAEQRESADLLLDNLVRRNLFDFQFPLAAFGSIRLFMSDIGEAYVHTSSSTFKGFSGGPVVSLNNPDELLGINVGGNPGASSALFLRMDTPLVMKVHDILVNQRE